MRKLRCRVLFLLCGFVSIVGTAQAQREKLAIAYSSLGGSGAPVYIAQDKGLFSRNNLETTLIYIGGGRIVAQAFAAGQIKMAIMAGPALVSANVSGLNLRMVGGLVNHSSYTLFVKPSINSPRDLKGKRFGLGSFGGSPDFIIRYILRHYGIDPEKEATILQLGGGGDLMRLAAMKAGTIDGALLSAPHTALAREAGFRPLVTPETLPIPYQQTGVAVTREFAEKNADPVRNVIRAIIEAIHFYKTNKEESLAILGRWLKTNDRAALEEMYREFAGKIIPRKPYPTGGGMAFIIESQKARWASGTVPKPEDYIDSRFVKELDDSGFIDRLYGGK